MMVTHRTIEEGGYWQPFIVDIETDALNFHIRRNRGKLLRYGGRAFNVVKNDTIRWDVVNGLTKL